MKSAQLFAILLLSAPTLRCSDFKLSPTTLPERAGIPIAYVGKQRGTLVAYVDGDPIVLIDGARRQVHRPPISVVPGGTFGAGFVTVADSAAQSNSGPTLNSGNRTYNYTSYFATMTPDRDLPDAILILLVFEVDPEGQFTEIPKVALLAKSLGRLKAGKKTDVSAYFPPLESRNPQRWTALLFSGGSQIHTSYGNDVLELLFNMIDRVGQKKAVAQRVAGDFPVAVYRHFPLKFSDDQKKAYAGQTLNLEVTITPEGLFDTLRIDGVSDDDMARDLAAQMAFWLFLPPVKDGQAQSTTFVLPIKF
jgi:hypothetical protein